MKKMTAADQPFELGDGILAFSLYLSGVPFLTTRNLYTADTLRKYGFKGEVDLGEAAIKCTAENKKGDVKYLFRRVKAIRRLVELHREQVAEITNAEGKLEAREVAHKIMQRYAKDQLSLEDAMMLLSSLILKLRPDFLNAWKAHTPLVQIDAEGETTERESFETRETPRGPRRVKVKEINRPGFKIVSAKPSDGVRQHLAL